MRVRDLLHAEVVELLHVHGRLCLLKLRNRDLSVVYGQEVNKLLKVLDLLLCQLHTGLEVELGAFFLIV